MGVQETGGLGATHKENTQTALEKFCRRGEWSEDLSYHILDSIWGRGR